MVLDERPNQAIILYVTDRASPTAIPIVLYTRNHFNAHFFPFALDFIIGLCQFEIIRFDATKIN